MHPKELTASSAASVSRPKRSLGEGDDIGCETSVTRSDQETMDTEDASESSTKRSKCSSSDGNLVIQFFRPPGKFHEFELIKENIKD